MKSTQTEKIRFKLVSSVTQYDKQQSGKRFYNAWALPQYLAAIDRAMVEIEKGLSPIRALAANFSEPLFSRLVKALGL